MILFINGAINSGKSTISKLLAEKIKNSAVVEIDSLRAFIEWMPIDEAVPINLENAVSVIKNFRKKGIDCIVPYPLSEKNYRYMVENLVEYKDECKVFTLSPTLDSSLTNRGSRELSEEEKERVKHLYKIGIHTPTFGEIIDNTDLKPEETAALIFSMLTK